MHCRISGIWTKFCAFVLGLHILHTQPWICASVWCDGAHSPAQASYWQSVSQVWGTTERHNCSLWGEGRLAAAFELGSSNRSCKQSRCDPLLGVQLEGKVRWRKQSICWTLLHYMLIFHNVYPDSSGSQRAGDEGLPFSPLCSSIARIQMCLPNLESSIQLSWLSGVVSEIGQVRYYPVSHSQSVHLVTEAWILSTMGSSHCTLVIVSAGKKKEKKN